MIQVEQVFDVRALGQQRETGKTLGREERDQRSRVAGQWVEGQAVLQLTQIKRGWLTGGIRGLLDLREHLTQIEEDLDRRRETDAWGAGQVTVLAVERAETIGREVPVVRTGIAFFTAETDRTAVLTQNERLLSCVMDAEWVAGVHRDAVMGSVETLNDVGVRIRPADALHACPTFVIVEAASAEDDFGRIEVSHLPGPIAIRFRREQRECVFSHSKILT